MCVVPLIKKLSSSFFSIGVYNVKLYNYLHRGVLNNIKQKIDGGFLMPKELQIPLVIGCYPT